MPEITTDRNDAAVRAWARAVHERDGCCVFCDSTDRLQAHHVFKWSQWPALRTQPGNGLVVCLPCHSFIHGGQLGD